MKKKQVILLAAMFAGGLALVQAQDSGTIVQGGNLAEKLEWLNVFSKSATSYVIELNTNESRGGSFTYGGKSGITVTIRGIDENRTIRGVLRVGSGTILVLDNNITVQGRVVVDNGGTLIMNSGTTVTGSNDSGVIVREKGMFTMNGGEIYGNKAEYGGGVWLDSNAIFTMNGGTISGNTVYEGGGGVYVDSNATFTMSGGTISGNAARSRYNSENGGGVYVIGTFTMSGGTISGNTAGRFGGGVFVTTIGGTFIMNDGEISGNTVTGNPSRGGGVSVDNKGTFTMNDGNISGNSSQSGGGVSVRDSGTFTMKKGTISGNTAIQGAGVDVGVDVGQATFTMSGGTISGNIASTSGGGINVWAGQGIFTKTGGTIYGYSESDTANNNVVKNDTNEILKLRGHAVYAGSANTLLKIRESTAGPGNNMAFNGRVRPPTASGAWDN